MAPGKDRGKSEQDVYRKVSRSGDGARRKTLDCQRRERGKRPNKPDTEEDKRVPAESPNVDRFLHEDAHEETAGDIDRERPGKGGELLVDQEPEDCTGEPADHDKEMGQKAGRQFQGKSPEKRHKDDFERSRSPGTPVPQ